MGAAATVASVGRAAAPVRPVVLAVRLSDDEREAHLAFIATLGENVIWRDYLNMPAAAA